MALFGAKRCAVLPGAQADYHLDKGSEVEQEVRQELGAIRDRVTHLFDALSDSPGPRARGVKLWRMPILNRSRRLPPSCQKASESSPPTRPWQTSRIAG